MGKQIWERSPKKKRFFFGSSPESKLSNHFRFHLEKSSGYKPVGGSNFTGNQHVVVGEIRGKVILVVPV